MCNGGTQYALMEYDVKCCIVVGGRGGDYVEQRT